MSSISIAIPILQPSLTDDSHSRIHFSNWKKALATAAQGICRTLDEYGAYSLVADDVEWNSHPNNIVTTTVSGTTTTTVRPRPVFNKPRIHAATEKVAVVINLFNYREVQWKEWTSASMALHQAMINSIGVLNLSTIERFSGHAGILSLTCQQLLGHIIVMFGSLHATDVCILHRKPHQGRTYVLRGFPRLHQSKLPQLIRHSREDPAPHQ
jgi:hypothetical protein